MIEKLEMFYRGTHIICEEDKRLRAHHPSGVWFKAEEATVTGSEAAIELNESGLILGCGGGPSLISF
jgi:hypothetical protein